MGVKATWLGEEETPDLKETVRFGEVFKKGEAVEIFDYDDMIKLKGNPHFKVVGELEAPETLTHIPPSQQATPEAVPKGGEPISVPPVAVAEPPPEAAAAKEKATAQSVPPKAPIRKV